MDAGGAGTVSAGQSRALGKLLDMDADHIAAIAASHKSFVYLKRQVPVDVAQRTMLLDVPGIYAQPDYRRCYPEGSIVSQVTGFAGVGSNGLEGIERSITVS